MNRGLQTTDNEKMDITRSSGSSLFYVGPTDPIIWLKNLHSTKAIFIQGKRILETTSVASAKICMVSATTKIDNPMRSTQKDVGQIHQRNQRLFSDDVKDSCPLCSRPGTSDIDRNVVVMETLTSKQSNAGKVNIQGRRSLMIMI